MFCVFFMRSFISIVLYLQCIYQLFYKASSSMDTGSMYQLRNLINRRDVTGPDDVVQKFR
ncbi:hypothetical protein DPMN_046489 [Dreissena polymorpha]|uniref:Uncharacterized protein n=1 Tax=Dreissena polymorpha TaxID=45954 RepID=A0A9D4D7Y1_DREPO|nr:hypothetical protein DPMN_046489 [Dreissena polymorpha]